MAAPNAPQLPRLDHPDPALVRWAADLVQALEDELARLRTPAGAGFYAITALTESRVLNPTTATTPQVGAVLGTLIEDLRRKGSIA